MENPGIVIVTTYIKEGNSMKVRKLVSILLALALLLTLSACGANSSPRTEAAYDYAAKEEMAPGSIVTDSMDSSSAVLPQGRKLIRTVQMEAETEDLTTLLANLDEQVAALNGYVEGREVYNGSIYSSRRYRHASMTIRIPAENLNSFVTHVEGASNVVSSNEYIDDVTTQYVDTESRVAALEIEQDRLLELLSKAESMEDILTIEDRLTDVRYELENMVSQLKTLDNQVNYATVHLQITEVQEYTPIIEEEPTVWERITQGFGESIEDITDDVKEFFIWVLVNSPYLVIWAAVITVIVLLLRKFPRKRKVKSVPNPSVKEDQSE